MEDVSGGGVTVRTRCGWGKNKECDELLYDRRLLLRLKETVHKLCTLPIKVECWH